MTENWLKRSSLLIGEQKVKLLGRANVLIVGLGGVGGFAAEFLARAGVGKMTIVDGDLINPTNINRQIVALNSTINLSKAKVLKERISDINPKIELTVLEKFLSPEEVKELVLSSDFSLVLDCIDSISPKISLILSSLERNIPLVSSMGAGGKIDVSRVKAADISKTHNCPLARNIRKRLKAVTGKYPKGFIAIFSDELPIEESLELTDGTDFKKSYYGTISYMPATFGIFAAAEAIKILIKEDSNDTNLFR